MAEITIRFRYDRKTGAKEMVVHLESDDDVLPHEHERDHRAWVEQLLGQPLDEDITHVVIKRAERTTAPEGAASDTAPRTATEQKSS